MVAELTRDVSWVIPLCVGTRGVSSSQSFSWCGGTSNRIKHRAKLEDERVEWDQVASDPGQDDGTLKGRNDHDGEIVSALERHAEVDQAFRERFEPTVECTPGHLAELLAGEITSPGVDDGSQQGARCTRL
jgi:hypothetical protein